MPVEAIDCDRLSVARLLPLRGGEGGFRALAAHRADDVERPSDALFKAALDRESAFVRRIGKLELHARWRIRQDERLANFEVLNHKRPPFEQLHAGFERHLDKRRRRKNDVVFDLVIFQESHVAGVEPNDPGRRRASAAGHRTGRARPVRAGRRAHRSLRSTSGSFPTRKRAAREDAAKASSRKNRAGHRRDADPWPPRAWIQVRAHDGPKRSRGLSFRASVRHS